MLEDVKKKNFSDLELVERSGSPRWELFWILINGFSIKGR